MVTFSFFVMLNILKRNLPQKKSYFSSLALEVFFNQNEFNVNSVLSEVAWYKNSSIENIMSEMDYLGRSGLEMLEIQKQNFSKDDTKKDIPEKKKMTAIKSATDFSKNFEKLEIPYAVGGALACGLWSIPRFTSDVDIIVGAVHGSKKHSHLLKMLVHKQVTFCDAHGEALLNQDLTAIQRNQNLNFIIWGTKFDLFFPENHSSSLEWTFLERKKNIDGVYYLDAESICAVKLLWHRSKDIPDLERLFAMRSDLDCDFITSFLTHHAFNNDDSFKIFQKLKSLYIKK